MRGDSEPVGRVVDEAEIASWLTEHVSALLDVDAATIDPDEPLESYGLASSDVVFLTGDLSELLGRPISAVAAWDHPTVTALASFLAAVSRGEAELPEDLIEWDLDADLFDF
jgi:acyl carrier protein